MPNLIDKTDIVALIPNTTLNIPDSEIDQHCKDAQIFDFQPRMPIEFYAALIGVRTTNLDALFKEFIIPVLAYSAFARYLLWNGKHVSRMGMRKIQESTSTEVNAKEIGELINDMEFKKDVSWTRLYNQLKTDGYAYDSVNYNFANYMQSTDKTKRSPHIIAV